MGVFVGNILYITIYPRKLQYGICGCFRGTVLVRSPLVLFFVIITSTVMQEIAVVLEKCSTKEAKVISDVVRATKLSMDKHL